MLEKDQIYSTNNVLEECRQQYLNMHPNSDILDVKGERGPFVHFYDPNDGLVVIGSKFNPKDQENIPDNIECSSPNNSHYFECFHQQNRPIPFFLYEGKKSWKYIGMFKPNGEISKITEREIYLIEETLEDVHESDEDNEVVVSDFGAGFGHPTNNKEVEEAAINVVTNEMERNGWTVISRESDRCGYDLECSKDDAVKHIEVKGCSGSKQSFFITSGEVKRAETDPLFELRVVTSVLANPTIHEYTGEEFLNQFNLKPTLFNANLKIDNKNGCKS